MEEKILKRFKESDEFAISHLEGHVYVKIPAKSRHMWSPQLHLSFEQEEEAVIIRGLYGPNPTLWAIFFFGYVVLGILTLFVSMWGFSKWSLEMDASILWAIPVFAVFALILYFSAQAGQKLGAQQMFDIHHRFEDAIGEKIIVN